MGFGMNNLISAFGGGHTTTALACLERIKGKNYFVIVDNDKLSEKKIKKLGYQYFKVIAPRKLGDSFLHPKVWFRFMKELLQALIILHKNKFDKIILTGYNPSIVFAFLGNLYGIKIINVEAIDRLESPSPTTKFLSYFSSVTWVNSKEQLKFFRNSKLVKPLIHEQKSGIKVNLPHPIISVFCGSTGFERVLNAIGYVDKKIKCSWIIQTGDKKIKKLKNKSIIVDFFSGISDLIEKSDIIITTGGRTALEVVEKNKNLIIFPRKGTLNEHQIKQAKNLDKRGLGKYVENKKQLFNVLNSYMK